MLKPGKSAISTLHPNGWESLAVPASLLPRGWSAWISETGDQPAWDELLLRTPLGQYQQSCAWGATKAAAGWRVHRLLITSAEGSLAGGCQILWKKKGPVRVGYAIKGPVFPPETPLELSSQLKLARLHARHLGLWCFAVQQPDEAREDDAFHRSGFMRANPFDIITATHVIDLDRPLDEIRAAMSASVRRNVRKARERGAAIREGTRTDLPLFFDLMGATCRRQGTRPNPPTLTALQALWDQFAPRGWIRLTFTTFGDSIPAGQLQLMFGCRVTLWKKGWNGSHARDHVNEFFEDEAIAWSHRRGFRLCDFGSLDHEVAETMVRTGNVPATGLSSRDAFQLRFGGRAMLLPPPLLHLPCGVSNILRHVIGRPGARTRRG